MVLWYIRDVWTMDYIDWLNACFGVYSSFTVKFILRANRLCLCNFCFVNLESFINVVVFNFY